MVRSPRVYVRDSGLVHSLLGIQDFNQLSGHPIIGASWEGFVLENLLSVAPSGSRASFFRTQAGAEIDLLLELPGRGLWAVEIKRSLVAKLERGFRVAADDLNPARSFVVYAGTETYPIDKNIQAVGLAKMAALLGDR